MTDTTETRTAGRSSPASPQADELPIHWAPATLTKHLQSPQVQLDGRTPGRIKSWTQRDGQGWNLSRLKKTINNHSFSEAIREPKSHMSWGECGDAQGWVQHWKVPAAIRIDVIIMTESLDLFCLPRKSSRHISPLILPTGCISPDWVPGFTWGPPCHCRSTSDS